MFPVYFVTHVSGLYPGGGALFCMTEEWNFHSAMIGKDLKAGKGSLCGLRAWSVESAIAKWN
ncbi:hypothetical protein CH371_18855 [Leptospira wolffii]|uniref:Uncharacterized protein n=1 Tax=Leptospira wolffii TaxID=409998 RepID=A0A2M9Z6X0_9LEPT|nr:hypothetical protein CH371_18855 [Leptospira wolffii]